jgi:SET domain
METDGGPSLPGGASASVGGPGWKPGAAEARRPSAEHLAFIWACFAQAIVNETRLEVRPTLLPLGPGQRGLFAACAFAAHEFLVEYRGRRVTEDQLDALYGRGDQTSAPYSIALRHYPMIIDAALKSESSVARYANDCRPETVRFLQGAKLEHTVPQPLGNNAAFVELCGRIFLRAVRPIEAGEEIFASYGEDYWGSADQQVRALLVEHLAALPDHPAGQSAPPAPAGGPGVWPATAPAGVPPAGLPGASGSGEEPPSVARWVAARGHALNRLVDALAPAVRLALGDAKLARPHILVLVHRILLAGCEPGATAAAPVGSVAVEAEPAWPSLCSADAPLFGIRRARSRGEDVFYLNPHWTLRARPSRTLESASELTKALAT